MLWLSQWYWTRDTNQSRIITALNTVLVFHCGSLALGSAVLAAVRHLESKSRIVLKVYI